MKRHINCVTEIGGDGFPVKRLFMNRDLEELLITQAEYDRAAERIERERETPLGEALDDLDQGVSDGFNCISGEMD